MTARRPPPAPPEYTRAPLLKYILLLLLCLAVLWSAFLMGASSREPLAMASNLPPIPAEASEPAEPPSIPEVEAVPMREEVASSPETSAPETRPEGLPPPTGAKKTAATDGLASTVVVHVSGGRRIGGRREERPLSDAEVCIYTDPRETLFEGTTDVSGVVRFEGLQRGFYSAEARHPGYRPARERFYVLVGHVDVRISLGRAFPGFGDIVGRVWLEGELLDDPLVFYRWDAYWSSRSAKWSPEESFHIENVPAYPVELLVVPRGWALGPEGIDFPSGSARVHVLPKAEVACELFLDVRYEPIRGRCTLQGGAPDAGRFVVAEAQGGQRFETRTDEGGRYVVEVPDIGLPYDVQAGRATDAEHLADVRPGSVGIDFVSPASIDFGVRALDAASGIVLRGGRAASRRAGDRDWTPARGRPSEAGYYLLSSRGSVVDVKVEHAGYRSKTFEGIHLRADGSLRLTVRLESAP